MAEVNLPSPWENCSLGDLLTGIQTGKSVRCDERPPQLQEKGLVKISAVTWGEFNEHESKTLLNTGHLQSSHKIDIGDLLISRANTLELVGACVMVKSLSKNLYLSDKVLRLELDELLKPLVLRYLNTKDARTQIESLATGNQLSMRNISQDAIRAIKLPLPPLAEQKVIAEKLDTLLAQVDNTKARLERIPDILKRFRQSVLAAAVSGKLTEEWRKQNGVSLEGWNDTNVGSLATVATGKTPSRTNSEYWDGALIPWLTSAATGAEYTFEAEQFVTERAVKECSLKVFPIGTILLAMYGEGKTRGQVTEIRLEATCNQACAAILVDTAKVSKEFLKLRLQENYEETRKAAAGGAQPNLNLNKVREIPVQLPERQEQTEIVRRVEELFAFADRIEQTAQAALDRINNLTQSILAKAFRGELTADWRAVNPELISGENSAEALLARIKTERTKLSQTKKGRSK